MQIVRCPGVVAANRIKAKPRFLAGEKRSVVSHNTRAGKKRERILVELGCVLLRFILEFLVHEWFNRRQSLRPDAVGHFDRQRGVGFCHKAGYWIDRQYVQSIALTERR